jgi:hypothetical protein
MAEQEVFEDIRYRSVDGVVAKGRHAKEIRADFRTSLKIPSGRNCSTKRRLDRKGYTRRRVSASRLLIEVWVGGEFMRIQWHSRARNSNERLSHAETAPDL